jgi:hypothetical protein
LAGKVTGTETAPPEQLTVWGSPAKATDELSTQLVALVTVAEMVLVPPPNATVAGLATKPVMEGAGVAADVGETKLTIDPAAMSRGVTISDSAMRLPPMAFSAALTATRVEPRRGS